jgi:hypothetical protein
MRTSYRALSIEAVEDRSLPSTFFFGEPGFGYAVHGREANFASDQWGGYQTRGNFGIEEISFRSQDGTSTFIFINNSGFNAGFGAGGFDLIPIFVGTGYGQTPTPTPIPEPTGTGTVGDGGNASNGGGTGQTGSSDFGPAPVAATHGAAQASSAAAFGPGAIAALLPNQAASTVFTQTTQQATNAGQVAAAANGQPAVALATTPAPTHAGYAITAITPDSDTAAPDDLPTPAPSMPLAPAPVPAPDSSAIASGVVNTAAAIVAPVAGFVPFDVTTLSAGATQFLDRVTDLAPAWPESMPAFNDSLWVAAAALLTGGAVHAAAVRSAPRSQEPFGKASALAEWERRNGRVTG